MSSKGIYHKWSEENMQKAMSAVKQNRLSVRKAAVQYGIPKSTLSDRITGKITKGAKMGRPAVLPEHAETQLA